MTLNELYRKTKAELERAGADAPAFDALCLFESVFSLDRAGLIMRGGEQADKDKERRLSELAQRRAQGEPLQYILGKWQFMDIELYVGEGVLIPREDTSCVVSAAIDGLQGGKSLKIADLCSGTGAIAIMLARELDCEATAVELYDTAYSYLEKNIIYNGAENVAPLKADVLSDFNIFPDNSLDLIISNPPYVESGIISSLQRELQYEPRTALDGGEDGYLFYRAITGGFTPKLRRGGMLCYELGEGQYDGVKRLMEENGIGKIGFRTDFQGIKRCIYGYRK